MESIISAVITGVLALAGVVISNMASNKKIEAQLEKQQAVSDVRLEELTREVRAHNNFAQRMPVVEEQIKGIHKRLANLESKD